MALKKCEDCGCNLEEADYDELVVRSVPCVCPIPDYAQS